MEILIRPSKIEDFESIATLSDQLGYSNKSEKIKERIMEIMGNEDNCIFVAFDNEVMIGWVHGFFTLRIESDPFVEIGGLVIDENYRKKGIGRLLVQKVEAWSKYKNVATLRVRCNTIRKESHQFYAHIGFKEVKEQKVFSLQLM